MADSVQQLYCELWGKSCPEFDEAVQESLNPRTPDVLYDLFAELKPTAEHIVLDIGCRYAEYAVDLVERFGCRAIAVDPIPLHMERAREVIEKAGMEDRITLLQGAIESIPVESAAVNLIWCRDMLNHVDLARGLIECARVLNSGGFLFIYQTFATDRLEQKEAARLFGSMAIRPENMDPSFFESAAQTAGFEIVKRDPIDSEWREATIERGSTELADSLLVVARMRRREKEFVARFGRERYEAAYGSELWGIYQMLGKLCPTVYVLRRTES